MNKLDSIIMTLDQELADGFYPAGARFPSESEIAKRFSVNEKTANKAVSMLVADGLLVRGIRGQGTRTALPLPFRRKQIVFLGDIRNPFYAEVLSGIESVARSKRYLVNYCSPICMDLSLTLNMLKNSPLKGIITHAYGKIDIPGIPVIHIDHKIQNGDTPQYMITANNFRGAYNMMNEILKRGHREIVIFFNPNRMPERLHGFQLAMKEAGIDEIEKRTFYSTDKSDFDARNILKKIQRAYPGFTAIATASDPDMLRMAKALNAEKIEWQNRIALTGFGNIAGISDMLPVATVNQHPYRMGCCAAEHLIDLMEQETTEELLREELDVEIMNVHNIPLLKH